MNSFEYKYLATPTRVVDGDTMIVDLDLGFRITHRVWLRLAGVNCPEPRGEWAHHGRTCTEFVDRLLRDSNGQFKEVKITTHKNPDSGGEMLRVALARALVIEPTIVLADVEVIRGGQRLDLVKDILIREGWGVAWDGKGASPWPWGEWETYPNSN